MIETGYAKSMVTRIPLTRFSTLLPAIAALESLSGSAAVEKQLLALNIPKDLLNAPDTLIPMQEFGFFYENAARFLGYS